MLQQDLFRLLDHLESKETNYKYVEKRRYSISFLSSGQIVYPSQASFANLKLIAKAFVLYEAENAARSLTFDAKGKKDI